MYFLQRPSHWNRAGRVITISESESESILDRVLDDPDVPDEVLGFHVQQSIEKRIKAVLAFHEVVLRVDVPLMLASVGR